MKFSKILSRFLFCLPFVIIVFYIHSYHGELINNAHVHWQYVKDKNDKIYLALDVYSPSGLRIESIYADGKDVTAFWRLTNYPDWYKGRRSFEKIDEFQKELHPYLPYNSDVKVLYTTGWYTFLYEWFPPDFSMPVPPKSSLKIKYQNAGTQNYYRAKHVSGLRVTSKITELTGKGPVINFDMLYPASIAQEHVLSNKVKIAFDNLIPFPSSGYVLKDIRKSAYAIDLIDEDKEEIIDSLKGSVRWDRSKAYQIYTKVHGSYTLQGDRGIINFNELFRHIAAIIFMLYFVLICWYVGRRFVRWRAIVLDSPAAKLVISILLGIIILTYLFFVIGILKLLYFPLLLVILSIILFLTFDHNDAVKFKDVLKDELRKIKGAPWRVIFLCILAIMLFYNFSYCFIPATYVDGSGDITNSYLPNINGYIISHSFKAAVENSTTGLLPQTFDVLRTVTGIFIGETGIYLLSFVYLLLILGGIYLIGKEIFKIKNMLVYLTVLMVLSPGLFTEGLHFGKFYPGVLSFLLISLYSIRFSGHCKNYILPPVFFAFFVSQYIYFILVALAYYLFIIVHSYYKYRTIKSPVFKLHTTSFIIFSFLSSIFSLKLFFETGIPMPPSLIPLWLRDLFLKLNQSNEMYKYIDNTYIRHFYDYHNLPIRDIVGDIGKLKDRIRTIYDSLDFKLIYILLPLLFKKDNYRIYKIFYIFLTGVILLVTFAVNNPPNNRVIIFYIYPLVIVQFAIVDALICRIYKLGNLIEIRVHRKGLVIAILFFVFFKWSSSGIETRKTHIGPATTSLRWEDPEQRVKQGFLNSFYYDKILQVFLCKRSKYQYLHEIPRDLTMFETAKGGEEKYFDHAMLIRQYTDVKDRILIVPVRFHSHAMRLITARHALGSVIYQKDINKIMADLKKLNINYLSSIPINYKDYNPFYTPIFEDDVFYKYFKLLFSSNDSRFYKIIHDGTNTEYTPTPYNVKGLPFIPMMRQELFTEKTSGV